MCCLLINQNYTIEKYARGCRFYWKGFDLLDAIFSSKYIHMLKQLNNCVRYKEFKKKTVRYFKLLVAILKPWSLLSRYKWFHKAIVFASDRFFNVINVRLAQIKKTPNDYGHGKIKDNFVWFLVNWYRYMYLSKAFSPLCDFTYCGN